MSSNHDALPQYPGADDIALSQDTILQYRDRVIDIVDAAGNELDDPVAWRHIPLRGKTGLNEQQRIKDRHAFFGRLVMELGPGTHDLGEVVEVLNGRADPDDPDAPAEITRKSVAAQSIDLREQLPPDIFRYDVGKDAKGKITSSTITLGGNIAVASAVDQTPIDDKDMKRLGERSKLSRMHAWAEHDDAENHRENIDAYHQATIKAGDTTLRLPLQSDSQRLMARILQTFGTLKNHPIRPYITPDELYNRLWQTMPSVELVASMDELFKPGQLRKQTTPTESFRRRVKDIVDESLRKTEVEYHGGSTRLVNTATRKTGAGKYYTVWAAGTPDITVQLQQEPQEGDSEIQALELPEHMTPGDTRTTAEAWSAETPQAISRKADFIVDYLRRLNDGHRDLSLSAQEAKAWHAFLATPEGVNALTEAWSKAEGGRRSTGTGMNEHWYGPVDTARYFNSIARGKFSAYAYGSVVARRHKQAYRTVNPRLYK